MGFVRDLITIIIIYIFFNAFYKTEIRKNPILIELFKKIL